MSSGQKVPGCNGSNVVLVNMGPIVVFLNLWAATQKFSPLFFLIFFLRHFKMRMFIEKILGVYSAGHDLFNNLFTRR